MSNELRTPLSFPAAHRLSYLQQIVSVDGASQVLPAPQSFTYAVLIWLFAGGVILPLVAAWWLPRTVPAECQTAPLAFQSGRDMNVTMKVSSGMSCVLLARVGSATLEDLIVETPPQYGTVSPRGRSGVIYRARRAYNGDDFFAIALRGRSNSEAGTMKIRVSVAVR